MKMMVHLSGGKGSRLEVPFMIVENVKRNYPSHLRHTRCFISSRAKGVSRSTGNERMVAGKERDISTSGRQKAHFVLGKSFNPSYE